MEASDIIKYIVEVVILVGSFFIGKYLIPYLKTKVDSSKLEVIVSFANIFVKAAEQMISGIGKGADKLSMVTGLLTTKAAEIGIDITEEETRAIIESAVKNMKGEE